MADNSIVLNFGAGKCFADISNKAGCKILSTQNKNCGTCKCPFYKPEGCREWIRKQDGKQVKIIPPEEYYTKRIQQTKKQPVWRIVRRRIVAPSAEQFSKAANTGDLSAESTNEGCVPLAVMAASTM